MCVCVCVCVCVREREIERERESLCVVGEKRAAESERHIFLPDNQKKNNLLYDHSAQACMCVEG